MALLGLLAAGCQDKMIPNTDVVDTAENRRVVEFVERYRKAVENRDIGTLARLASPKYYDDNGTPKGDDDVDFDRLKAQLRAWRQYVADVRYEIRYRNVRYEGDKVLVDFTYTGSFKVTTPSGPRWARRLADNRLTLTRDRPKESFLVVSGM